MSFASGNANQGSARIAVVVEKDVEKKKTLPLRQGFIATNCINVTTHVTLKMFNHKCICCYPPCRRKC